MKAYTFASKVSENSLLTLKIPNNVEFNKINIISSCFYSIYYKNKLVQFGPFRRTHNRLNLNELILEGNTSDLEIKIIYYGIPTFDLECRKFIFGIEFYKDNKVVISSESIQLCLDTNYISISNKFSFQRGFVERYDLTQNLKDEIISLVETNDYQIISEYKDSCLYIAEEPKLISSGPFNGFDNDFKGLNYVGERNNQYNVKNIIDSFKNGYLYNKYKYSSDITGIFHLEVESENEQTIYLVFDEYLPDGKWIFGRCNCNDLIEVKLKKGHNSIFSNVPYTYGYAMVIYKEGIKSIKLESVKIQNDKTTNYLTGDKDIDAVLEASKRTFDQNAFDIFTDCPGRERAGWLCDSYFEGIAEPFYTGKHDIEKAFLENYLYEDSPEIVDGMIPMCFPSIHADKTFIPNWALWFIVEVERYYNDTKDQELVNSLKPKIMGILNYFNKFENELGLLENLESWEFIEWSKATEDEYIKPISFVSNMTYKGAVESAGRLYKDDALISKAANLSKVINELSFNGKYFVDNAQRIDGKVVPNKSLISETAQYFAYFFNIRSDEIFVSNMINCSEDKSLAPSAIFIGKFLRLLNLYKLHEYQQIIDEFIPYFKKMSLLTGTLWEKENATASCNHGFASVLGPIIFDCFSKIKYHF